MTTRPPCPDPVLRAAALVLAGVAALVALKLAEDIMLPLVAALVAGVIFAPLSTWLHRLGLPPVLAASLIFTAGIAAIAALAFLLEPYLWRLLDQLPRIRWEMQKLLGSLRELIQGIDAVNDEVAQALGDKDGNSDSDAAGQVPNLMDALFLAPIIVTQLVIFLGALFFFLLTRQPIYAWLADRVGRDRDTDDVLARIRSAERVVSTYFLTITIINFGMGAVVAAAMTLLGLPGAILWGIAAAMLNFVLYLGPAVMLIGLSLAGILVFDGALSFAPPAIFLVINLIEAQFCTPAFVGRSIDTNPLMIFVSLVFWLWLWGPIGGVIAIPILVIVTKAIDILRAHPAR